MPSEMEDFDSQTGVVPNTSSPRAPSGVTHTDEATRTANRLTLFLAALAVLLLLRFFVPYFAERIQYALTRGRERAEAEIATEALGELPLRSLSKAYQLVAKRVGPSVVNINVRNVDERSTNDEVDFFFGGRRPETEGQGSGVIVDEAGYVVTNNHVVAGATEIQVSLSDGRVLAAEIVGTDALTDLAVLRVNASGLVAAEWSNSDKLEVGELVWAIGSPFGLQQSITFGILSAKNRESQFGTAWQNFLQTDAAVNPGNSGGPLVDALGRVVGINTAIVGQSYQGISFAIPSSVAQRVYQKIRTEGRVARGWLGVQLGDVASQMAEEFGWSVDYGAYVHTVVGSRRNPSPAQRAGIRPGDIIIQWNGQKVPDAGTLTRLVAGTELGADVEAVLIREGRETTLMVHVEMRQLD
ncbi:MAG: serine protease [Planctomycetaceae bacterium]|nr:serine protease [Planctomycetaceae bacterium]